MKTSKQVLENLVDALLEAEPILRDAIRELARARAKLCHLEALANKTEVDGSLVKIFSKSKR